MTNRIANRTASTRLCTGALVPPCAKKQESEGLKSERLASKLGAKRRNSHEVRKLLTGSEATDVRQPQSGATGQAATGREPNPEHPLPGTGQKKRTIKQQKLYTRVEDATTYRKGFLL